jgi:hypothetical protein
MMKRIKIRRRISSLLRRTRERLLTPARGRPQRRMNQRSVSPSARRGFAKSPRMVPSKARTRSFSMLRVVPFHLWSITL